jgi:hypothetical protein
VFVSYLPNRASGSGVTGGQSGSDRALAAIRNSNSKLLSPEFWLLAPGFSKKYIFWKNEAKLCPSLLTIVKKTNPNQSQKKPFQTRNQAS